MRNPTKMDFPSRVYPGRAAFRARTTDPRTSHTAAAMVDAEGQRRTIMDALAVDVRRCRLLHRDAGLTADELDTVIGWRVTTAGRRLGELKRDGFVEPCGERLTRSGRPATVYRACA